MAIPTDYETEKDAATEWLKLKIRVEALQDRIRSGDIEAEAAIENLFKSA